MNIDDLKVGDVKAIVAMFGQQDAHQPFEIGKGYFIRTVTHYLTGRIVSVGQQEIVVEEAAWIADTGRYADALKSHRFKEVEPYPDGKVIIGRGSIIDAVSIDKLPREQK